MEDDLILEDEEFVQLTQKQVPLEDAGEAFMQKDENGRTPIIIVPKYPNRIRNELVIFAVLILLGSVVIQNVLQNLALASLLGLIGVVLLILGVYRSFIVRVPEGANALLMRGGRYIKTVGSGTNLIPPWIFVSHLVTRREIPFDVPVVNAPTQDNVRASVDTLLTFTIINPFKFVYSISATDFDQVLQAICQDTLRSTVRQITTRQVLDMKRNDLMPIIDVLNKEVDPYGVTINKINVTYAQPPADFMVSEETRLLANFHRAEQVERQALMQEQQANNEALARQEVLARVEREREALQFQYQQEEARRRVVEMVAETEAFRLEKLEERLKKYPDAVKYELELKRLEIAQGLSTNNRAMLQIGSADDIAKAFMMHEIMTDDGSD